MLAQVRQDATTFLTWQVPLPLDPFAPVGMPPVAWHPYADSHGMDEV